MPHFRLLLTILPMAMLAACSPAAPDADTPAREAAAAQVDPGMDTFPANLQAAGVEPFWGVKVEGGALAYTTPETMDAPRRLQATRSIDADGLHLSGEERGQPFRLDVRHEPCSDGMSDTAYPFSVSWLLEGKTAKGCAFDPASPPPPQ
ncbi:hypothetical protein [Stenotrophomonas sp. PS02297]|uniref:COG3650 family protein n=1 Tax=Stenotrophomonas sp. PS02297 TaxID=2991423 RepID=UPI00249BDB3B|nr:hypothetical protein [Stenotrophomonas sp. PS02297]